MLSFGHFMSKSCNKVDALSGLRKGLFGVWTRVWLKYPQNPHGPEVSDYVEMIISVDSSPMCT